MGPGNYARHIAGIKTHIGNHTFRATGSTIYLTNGGDLEKAQQMAAHESLRMAFRLILSTYNDAANASSTSHLTASAQDK